MVRDDTGNGQFTDTDDITDERTFTLANEVVDQTITDDPASSTLDFLFDEAGNQTGREVNPDLSGADDLWTYIYDAWNRLVKVEIDPEGPGQGASAVVRAQYQYNGLHERTVREADESGDGTLDTRNHFYYDASWRLLEERVDDDYDGSTFTLEKIIQRIWCPLYIDALIAMQTDLDDAQFTGTPDGDFTGPGTSIFYAILDRKYDVVAMMAGSTAVEPVRERVRYTPYGVARHQPSADFNGDGMVNGTDQANLLASWGAMGTANYRASSDLDRDGDVDGSDLAILFAVWSTTAEPEGVISRIGNTIGSSGYVYDNAVNMNLARFRWYDAETGRWATRDPYGYFDGSQLYQYVRSNPVRFVDSSGLFSADPSVVSNGGSKIPTCEEIRDINDPNKGCGVILKRNLGQGGDGEKASNFGHQWIEYWEVAPDNQYWLRGLGFWPGGWFTGAPPESDGNRFIVNQHGVTIRFRNDPYTGTPGDVRWRTTRPTYYEGMKALKHGSFRGVACRNASCDMIRDCLREYAPDKQWSTPLNDCRVRSSEALSDCCLTTLPIQQE